MGRNDSDEVFLTREGHFDVGASTRGPDRYVERHRCDGHVIDRPVGPGDHEIDVGPREQEDAGLRNDRHAKGKRDVPALGQKLAGADRYEPCSGDAGCDACQNERAANRRHRMR